MEQYSDIYSLLGLQEAQFAENNFCEARKAENFSVLCQNRSNIKEDALFDTSELFDFLSNSECKEELNMNDLDCLNNLDLDFNLRGLSEAPSLTLPPPNMGGDVQSCDLIDTESDSGIESMKSVSPQDSPRSEPPPPLSLSSITALLPDTPLAITELGRGCALLPEYMDTADTEMLAVPPRLIRKENLDVTVPSTSDRECIKKPSLLSCLLSIPPVETKAAKQLSSLLNREMSATKQVSQVDMIVNFINSSKFVSEARGPESESSPAALDSFKQKHNGRAETELNVRSVPSLENELMGIKYNVAVDVDTANMETQRKKLIINKRKKELINTTAVSPSESTRSVPWDGDLRLTMVAPPGDLAPEAGPGDPRPGPQPPRPPSSRTYLCPTCGASFASSAARSLHRRHLHQRHHLCSVCDRAFATQQKLERHLRTHKSEKKFKCDVCFEEFSLADNLEYHYTVHSETKLLKCRFCNLEYFTTSGLNSHLKQVHCNETHYRCTRCDYVGKTCLELEIHSETDHSETLITSNRCNQQFIDNALHTPPQLLHSNEKVSKCPVNSVNGEAELQLDIARKTHSITKKHTCKHCGHKFAFKNSLTKHLSKGRCIILKKSLQQNINVAV